MSRLLLMLAFALVAGTARGQAAACPSRLFVSGYETTVQVFDACTGAHLRELDAGSRIRGAQAVKLGPDGLVYVVSEKSQQILRYRNDTLEFDRVFAALPGADPTGIAFGANGDAYVAAFKTSEVRRLSPAGVPIDVPVPAHTPGLLGPDNGMTFGPDGNLYIPGYNSSTVVRHDPRTGQTEVAVGSGTAGLLRTRGILAEPTGKALLVSGEGSGQVLRLDLDSGAVSVLLSGAGEPTGLAYAPDGDLLVLTLSGSVSKFDPVTGAAKALFVAPRPDVVGGTYLAVIPAPTGTPPPSPVIEFYHAGLDHYFISALAADIAALDSGKFAGWARTGLAFNAYPQPAVGTSPVCRFYLPPASGDSHFYSASPAECDAVRGKFPAFVYEAPDVMYIVLPDTVTGACPPGTATVYRLWNQRVDSNHRYTTDPTVKAAMLTKGYLAEGYGPGAAIMCAPN
jgi:streptogramin lyase